jgi:sugar O-acyltransferase (sialic acid O-acetyltransferase NeuD family)
MSSSAFLIWGAGGHAKVVADLVRACGHRVVGIIDRDPGRLQERTGIAGLTVIQQDAFLERIREAGGYPDGVAGVVLAIGDNQARQRCLQALDRHAVPFLIHPSAVVSPSATVGAGTVVFPTAVINADAEIGAGVIVNSAAVVEHDCVVGDAAHISPGAILAGGVRLGERSWIGAGATVIQGVVVGADATVGAGAVVIRHVPDGITVAGVPAMPIGRRQ